MDWLFNLTGIIFWGIVGLNIVLWLLRYLRGKQSIALAQRWVVVTGGDSGIGLGVIEKLIAEKASVIALTYTEEGAKRALAKGAKFATAFDITDEAALNKAVTEIKALTGELWGIVHCAGLVRAGFIEFQPIENYRRIMDVNFFAVVKLSQAIIPMIKPTQGRIVIISSVDGIVSLPGNAPYDASKFAIEAYVDALRVELSFWDVHVSVINPSTFKTPLAMGFFQTHMQTWKMMDQQDPNGEWKKAYSADWIEKYVKANEFSLERIAQDPQEAVDDIYHALASKHPKTRYLSGRFAKTLFFALWKMPESWSFAFKKTLINPPPVIQK